MQNYSAGGFLNHVVTFHSFFAMFATPTMLPLTDLLMKWGHLLIGLSLVFGLMVRISGPFGILLMLHLLLRAYGLAFLGNDLSLIVDYHLIYDGVMVYLIANHAGHVSGSTVWSKACRWSRIIPACGRCLLERKWTEAVPYNHRS